MKKIFKALTLVLFVNLFALSAFCAKPAVEDRVNYSKKVVKQNFIDDTDFGYHKIKIPKITVETNVTRKINADIYNQVGYCYEKLLSNSEREQIFDIDYEYREQNGIVGIVLSKSYAPQYGGWNSSISAYYYDANRDKQLSFNEYMYLLGIKSEDILKNESVRKIYSYYENDSGFYGEDFHEVIAVIADSKSCVSYIYVPSMNPWEEVVINNYPIKPINNTSNLVVDAVNHEENVSRTEMETDSLKASLKHSVKLPKLAKETKNAKAFNQKMIDTCTWYSKLRENIVTDYIVTYTYDYKVHGGIVAIMIDSSVERYSESHERYMFYYDTVRDKELTYEEYLKRVGVSEKDLVKTYNDNKDNTNLSSNTTVKVSTDKINGALIDSGSLTLLLKNGTVVEIFSPIKGLNSSTSNTYKGSVGEIVMTIGSKVAYVDGAADEVSATPMIIDGRTMLPARYVAESMGADVSWDSVKKEVTITKDGIKMVLGVNKKEAYVNQRQVSLDAPVTIKNGSTYTPLRFIVETLGGTVDWIQSTKQVVIYKNVSVADVLTEAYREHKDDKYKYSSFLADIDSDGIPEIIYSDGSTCSSVDKYKNGEIVTLDKYIQTPHGMYMGGEVYFVICDNGEILISKESHYYNPFEKCMDRIFYNEYYFYKSEPEYEAEFDGKALDDEEIDDIYNAVSKHFGRMKKKAVDTNNIEFDTVWKIQKRRYANANG